MDHTAWTTLISFLDTTEIAQLLRTCRHSKTHYLIVKVEIAKRKLQLEKEIAELAERTTGTKKKLFEYLHKLQKDAGE